MVVGWSMPSYGYVGMTCFSISGEGSQIELELEWRMKAFRVNATTENIGRYHKQNRSHPYR